MKQIIKRITIFSGGVLVLLLAGESIARNLTFLVRRFQSPAATKFVGKVGPYEVFEASGYSGDYSTFGKEIEDLAGEEKVGGFLIVRDGHPVLVEATAKDNSLARVLFIDGKPRISWNPPKRQDTEGWLSFEVYEGDKRLFVALDFGLRGEFRYRQMENLPLSESLLVLQGGNWVPFDRKTMEMPHRRRGQLLKLENPTESDPIRPEKLPNEPNQTESNPIKP
jgi:hypothetical protein